MLSPKLSHVRVFLGQLAYIWFKGFIEFPNELAVSDHIARIAKSLLIVEIEQSLEVNPKVILGGLGVN